MKDKKVDGWSWVFIYLKVGVIVAFVNFSLINTVVLPGLVIKTNLISS